MNGASLPSFLAMGGYAAYVWPAYGFFFTGLLVDWCAPQWRRRGLLRQLRVRLTRQSTRKGRTSVTSPQGEPVSSAVLSPGGKEWNEEQDLP